MVPRGHTSFSWCPSSPEAPPPLSHTVYSWGGGAKASNHTPPTSAEKGGGFGGGKALGDKPAVKKGFLADKAAPVGDVGVFLHKRVVEVIEQVEELHRREEEDESAPFKQKYAARDLLKGLTLQLNDCKEEAGKLGLAAAWEEGMAGVEHQMGVNLVETEEISAGEKQLNLAIKRMKDTGESTKFACQILDSTNHLGLIWSQRGEHQKAEGFLISATEQYDTFVKAGCDDKELASRMEGLRTTTLFLMAQVYQHLGHPDMSAKYCQITLNRSLKGGLFDALDWTKNAVQLSGFYLSQGRYGDSAACLASAEQVMCLIPADDAEENRARVGETSANLAWGWGKLHTTRLDSAAHGEEAPKKGAHEAVEFDLEGVRGRVPEWIEAKIVTYEDACREMKAGLRHLDKVRAGFPIDEDCSNHVEACQDISKLYRSLVAFTSSDDDKCKMHKRRIDILEPLVTQLNIAAYDALCKELRFELGEVYRDMMEIKIVQVDSGQKKIKWEKIAELCDGAVKHYRQFARLFQAVPGDPQEAKNPSKVTGIGEEKVRRWYLNARFYCARCLLKRPDPDMANRKVHLNGALEEYRHIVALAEAHPFKEGQFSFDDELRICKEMVALLPSKIERLHMLPSTPSGT